MNQQLVSTYWAVGADILARQHDLGWGARVIDRLSADLQERFPGIRGFSPRNLKYMRAFAQAWPDPAIVQRSVAPLPWRHHVALMEKLDTTELRLFYAAAALENGWTRDVLVHHIRTRFHERAGRAVTNFPATMPPADSDMAQQATRDPYLFDFIGIAHIRRERDLEQGLSTTSAASSSSSAKGSRSSAGRSGWTSTATSSTATCCSTTSGSGPSLWWN